MQTVSARWSTNAFDSNSFGSLLGLHQKDVRGEGLKVISGVGMLSDYVVKYQPAFAGGQGTSGSMLGERYQSFPQCPATASRPTSFIERDCGAKCFAALPREERPSDRYVACRIANPRRPEIDHSTQAPFGD